MQDDEILSTALTCTATNFPILANGFKIKWVHELESFESLLGSIFKRWITVLSTFSTTFIFARQRVEALLPRPNRREKTSFLGEPLLIRSKNTVSGAIYPDAGAEVIEPHSNCRESLHHVNLKQRTCMCSCVSVCFESSGDILPAIERYFVRRPAVSRMVSQTVVPCCKIHRSS